jgi:hypothetical protein
LLVEVGLKVEEIDEVFCSFFLLVDLSLRDAGGWLDVYLSEFDVAWDIVIGWCEGPVLAVIMTFFLNLLPLGELSPRGQLLYLHVGFSHEVCRILLVQIPAFLLVAHRLLLILNDDVLTVSLSEIEAATFLGDLWGGFGDITVAGVDWVGVTA